MYKSVTGCIYWDQTHFATLAGLFPVLPLNFSNLPLIRVFILQNVGRKNLSPFYQQKMHQQNLNKVYIISSGIIYTTKIHKANACLNYVDIHISTSNNGYFCYMHYSSYTYINQEYIN